jgi:hypothetical protein
MHVTSNTALNLKKVKGKSERPPSFIERSLGIIHHAHRTKKRCKKKKKLSGWESNPGYLRLGRCFPSS